MSIIFFLPLFFFLFENLSKATSYSAFIAKVVIFFKNQRILSAIR